jgi:hypothetical protein
LSRFTSHNTRTQVAQMLGRSLVALTVATCLAILPQARAQEPQNGDLTAAGNPLVLTVDVAEDFTKFNPTFVKPTDTEPRAVFT